MWALIFGGLIFGSILGVLYISSRFAKFSFVRKAAGGRRWACFLIGLFLTVLIGLAVKACLGTINAEIAVLHLVIVWLLCDGIAALVNRKRKKKLKRYYAGMFALGVTAVYLTCGWYLSNHVWRTAYVLKTDKNVGNLRIVQFADSHVGNTFDGEEFLGHVKAMQEENPDLVVVTGDYVDDDTSKEDMAAACRALGTLRTTYGVYYVFGNHDKGYYGPEYRGYDGGDLIAELEKNNVTVLEDETVLIGQQFYLIGRQDRSEEQRGNRRASMQEMMKDLDADRYSIVLDHQPYDYDAQSAAGVDLVLSGHTHGGHFFPINSMGEWLGIDAKTYGLEQREGTDFIVTSGISEWAIQFRTGCKSEYVVVDIQGNTPVQTP